MGIPNFLQSCLASYQLKNLNKRDDKDVIITEILNKGDDRALRWLGKTYSRKEIRKTISMPKRGMWMNSVLKYWLKIFDFNLDKNRLQQALINLNQV